MNEENHTPKGFIKYIFREDIPRKEKLTDIWSWYRAYLGRGKSLFYGGTIINIIGIGTFVSSFLSKFQYEYGFILGLFYGIFLTVIIVSLINIPFALLGYFDVHKLKMAQKDASVTTQLNPIIMEIHEGVKK